MDLYRAKCGQRLAQSRGRLKPKLGTILEAILEPTDEMRADAGGEAYLDGRAEKQLKTNMLPEGNNSGNRRGNMYYSSIRTMT